MDFKKKGKIIPEDMKIVIDEILEAQLFNANRYYAESNPTISQLMQIEVKKSPVSFLDELRWRWNWHNTFYEDLLEPAFLEILNCNSSELSPVQISELISVYITCCLVDETTLVTSGAMKKHLDYHSTMISLECEGVSRAEAHFMLLTPPDESFFTQREIDHLRYVILLKTNPREAETFKGVLLKKYHADDELIFKGRFLKRYSSRLDSSIEELQKDIESLTIGREYRTRHFYFTLGHDERKAFRDIIKYDNIDEKFIASQLVGISGFLLRKRVLEYLNESGLLLNKGYIYEFSNEKVVAALNCLLEERKKNMEMAVRPYKQNGMTCAIACMLMVLEYHKIIHKASYGLEQEYFRRYRSRHMDGTPFSALAWHFAKNGLDTEILHSSDNIFDNSLGVIPQHIYEESMKEYKSFLCDAEKKGAVVQNGVEINCDLLKNKLETGKMIILAGQYQGSECLHAILLCGYQEDKFVVCDPLCKKKQLWTSDQIMQFMNTAIGTWCVTVGAPNRNKEKLIAALPDYQAVAHSKLSVGCLEHPKGEFEPKRLKRELHPVAPPKNGNE